MRLTVHLERRGQVERLELEVELGVAAGLDLLVRADVVGGRHQVPGCDGAFRVVGGDGWVVRRCNLDDFGLIVCRCQ